ncbi:Rieske 2Fe-2S domain-containing protein [Duganella sp. FT94W]|uniref:Rieske 2Fe-2S domain-containing protein n=1 Tax=Duganella lactea TaxID=2692173 RepID=A0ABW9V6T4_9BURK|nr:Rieske (2Fe-2S) protein [Duganella lactea]MYM34455.1 Rieske 2Fe-2S domain-containing protein [Duganella lactea]
MHAPRLRLCRLDELADGEARGFDPLGHGQDSVLLVRQGARLHAYRDLCPHYGDTPMAWRRHAYLNAERSHIVCAAHGAWFEIDGGACIRGPCLGQSLTPVGVSVDTEGDVWLDSDTFNQP